MSNITKLKDDIQLIEDELRLNDIDINHPSHSLCKAILENKLKKLQIELSRELLAITLANEREEDEAQALQIGKEAAYYDR